MSDFEEAVVKAIRDIDSDCGSYDAGVYARAILATPEMQSLLRLYVAVGNLKINERYDDSTEVDQAYNAVPMSVHLWA